MAIRVKLKTLGRKRTQLELPKAVPVKKNEVIYPTVYLNSEELGDALKGLKGGQKVQLHFDATVASITKRERDGDVPTESAEFKLVKGAIVPQGKSPRNTHEAATQAMKEGKEADY